MAGFFRHEKRGGVRWTLPLTFVFVLVLAVGVAAPESAARPLYNEPFNYWIDLPERWGVVDTGNLANVSFADPRRRAVLQVFAFAHDEQLGETLPGGERPDEVLPAPAAQTDPGALADYFERRFQAAGNRAPFEYLGRDAVLADWSYLAGSVRARGYWLFWQDDDSAYAAGAFAPEQDYERYHDTLVSALDSFAPGIEARLTPGPISQFYYAYPPPEQRRREIVIGDSGYALPLPADDGEIEATRVLIEREARVLHTWYTPGQPDGLWKDAWRRFYRAIYRDNYRRLAPLVPELLRYFRREGIGGDEVPHALLSWLQNFAYRRVGGDADVQPPLSSLITGSGDCDSLGIVYATLLHHLGYEAILMVSHEYGHAMVGVDVDGEGARFEYGGTAYLVAELTDNVPMGRIDQSIANPAGWIGVVLRP